MSRAFGRKHIGRLCRLKLLRTARIRAAGMAFLLIGGITPAPASPGDHNHNTIASCLETPGAACLEARAREMIEAAPWNDDWAGARVAYARLALAKGRIEEALSLIDELGNPSLAALAYHVLAIDMLRDGRSRYQVAVALERSEQVAASLQGWAPEMLRIGRTALRLYWRNGDLSDMTVDSSSPYVWPEATRAVAAAGGIAAAVEFARRLPTPMERASALAAIIPSARRAEGRARAAALVTEVHGNLVGRSHWQVDWTAGEAEFVNALATQTAGIADRPHEAKLTITALSNPTLINRSSPHMIAAFYRAGETETAHTFRFDLSAEGRCYAMALIAGSLEEEAQREALLHGDRKSVV